MLKFFIKLFGTKTQRELKKLIPTVNSVNDLEASIKALSDDQLKGKTLEFRQRILKARLSGLSERDWKMVPDEFADQMRNLDVESLDAEALREVMVAMWRQEEKARNGSYGTRLGEIDAETLEELLPEAFAVVRESAVRIMGMRHYDVQILGGIILHKGAIAEMKTGEGKTLTSTAPVYLNALLCRGVHVVTVNDYLASRDAEWMGKIYNYLGMSVDCVLHGLTDQQRQTAYSADITYGTNNELGFDYLRDNMKHSVDQLAQRDHYFAIVDEVDSVLIDEARTPLIISGPAEGGIAKYGEANEIVKKLKADEHFTVDEKDRNALLNEDGIAAAEQLLKVDNLYDPSNIEILHCIEKGLHAHYLFKKDVDYVVEDDQVVIIDSHTGRKMPGRRYSDGLHQALEAKEGVRIAEENQTLASVTFQNYFRMYAKLSGMTGTADTEATEFSFIYKMETYVIPTNKPLARDDRNDQIYGTRKEKYEAILDEIEEHSKKGRPVLVGTIAIETSEEMSEVLRKRGVKHVVLNAKFHERESEIVAQAGRLGAVTIATNMAGRGTDIVLGGNPEMLAKSDLERNPELDYEQVLAKYKAECAEEKKRVLELGGLCIIGTERHDSRRIDNQLRGRAGRQGDPGLSQFYLSMEDDLMRIFGNERMKKILLASMEPGVPIEHKMVNRAIERAQKTKENQNFEARKHLLEYDDVMNKQRTTFYRMRRELLSGQPRDYLFSRVRAIVNFTLEDWRNNPTGQEADALQELCDKLNPIFNLELKPEDVAGKHNEEDFAQTLIELIETRYAEKWDTLGIRPEDVMKHERFLMLYMLDQQWKDHMRSMDHLKQGISLQGYAQKDPLIEYKKASFEMFNELMDRMDEEVVKMLIQVQPRLNDESVERMRRQREREAQAMRMQAAQNEEEAKQAKTVRRSQPKVGRNEPCHCGSGKKFKNCHGR